MKRIDSLLKRYFFRLITNILILPINAITHAIIPRILGPTAYGNFSYINNFFNGFVGLINSGTSSALFTKLSKRPKEKKLIQFYFIILIILTLLVILFTIISYVLGFDKKIFPNVDIRLVFFGMFWGLLFFFSMILDQILDAQGQTVIAEKRRLLVRTLGFILFLILFVYGFLNLTTLYIYNYLILTSMIFIGIIIFKTKVYNIKPVLLSVITLKSYTREFYSFCHPLLFYSVIGSIAGLTERWFLQKFGGSEQQGYYSIAVQIGAICFLLTGAMTQLFQREI